MPLSADMPSIPEDLRMAAEASDAEIEGALSGLIPAPDKPYSPKVLGALAKAITEVAKLMQIDLKPEPYTQPAEALEPEVVRFLAMVDAASKDYGAPLPVALEDIRGDKELMIIAAHLTNLAKDAAFNDFLNMPLPEEGMGEEGMETEVEVKVKPGKGEEMGEEEDFDFASRMKPRR